MKVGPTGLDLEAIRGRAAACEWPCLTWNGAIRAVPSAADVPALLDEVDRLRTLVAALVAEDGPGSLVGFVKHNGAGEIVFRQASHPSNQPGEPWVPVFCGSGEPTGSAS